MPLSLRSPSALLITLLVGALSAPPASADDARYEACLEAAAQPPRRATLQIVGPNSRVRASTYGAVVTGLWNLSCGGESDFDERVIATFADKPPVGRVVDDKVPRAALRCFVESCTFPAGVCPGRVGDAPVIELCGGGYITSEALTAGPGDPPPPLEPEPAPEEPGVTRVVIGAADTSGDDDPLRMPAPPAPDCESSGALKAESRAHLDLGNQAELAGDLDRAAAEYRAALSLSPCNALAWTGLGMLAARMSRPDRAIQALKVALELNPGHYGAATALGESYEAMGQLELAAGAFRAALEARPEHRPAARGLERVSP